MKRSTLALRRSEIRSKRRVYTRECESCGTTFQPWDSMARFCSQKCFGASRVQSRPCDNCGEQRPHGNDRYCSKACEATARTMEPNRCVICDVPIAREAKACNVHRHTPKRLTREKTCALCNKSFIPYASALRRSAGKYCSKACYNAFLSLRPAFVAVQCAKCGTTFRRTQAAVKRNQRSFCSSKCSTQFYSGEQAPMYRGGNKHRRGPGWHTNRRLCRERDRVCRSCGKTPEQNKQALSVDHLIPWRLFADELMANDLANLVALCRVCHAKKTARAEQAYMRGDVLAWNAFLIDVGVDLKSLAMFEEFLLPVGVAAA